MLDPRPRCVLFDAVGTLIRPVEPIARTYLRVGVAQGALEPSQMTEAELAQRFSAAFADVFRARTALASEAAARDAWREVVRRTFSNPANLDAVFDTLWEHYALPASWLLYEDTLGLWRALAGANLAVGVASNFDRRLRVVLAGHPRLSDGDRVFLATEVGAAKPDPAFFREVAARLALAPAEILLLGDCPRDDLPARESGWQVLLVDRTDAERAAASLKRIGSELLTSA